MTPGPQPLFDLGDSHISGLLWRKKGLIRVKIAGHLVEYTGGKRELQVGEAPDVLGMIKELDQEFPGIEQRILNDQERIRAYVNVFVNNENARDSEEERTRLKDGDTVHILPSVAGG
jgi:sulfur-carrier protein